MKAYKIIVVTVIAYLISFSVLAGGGWIDKKGKGYFKISQSIIRSGDFFDADGNLISIPTISLYTSSIYAEYGISNRLTGVLYAPFFVRTTLNKVEFSQSGNTIPGDALNSFGDTNVGLKYGFFQDKSVVMAASLTFGLPLGSSEVSSERVLQTGDGEFNQLLKLEASRSFKNTPLYATLVVGLNNRSKGFSDEFHYGFEIGASLNKFIPILKIYSVNSFFNGDDTISQSNGVFANNTEYFSFTPELNYFFTEKAGLSLSGGFAFSGKQILASPNYSIGLFWKL